MPWPNIQNILNICIWTFNKSKFITKIQNKKLIQYSISTYCKHFPAISLVKYITTKSYKKLN